MLLFILNIIPIFYTVAAPTGYSKDISYDNSVNVIVKDMVENWESPFDYLKSRGYLTDYPQSAPDLGDFQQPLEGYSGQELPLNKDSKRDLDNKENKLDPKAVYSPDKTSNSDLRKMFRNLFSSDDDSATKDINSKLGVDWDMNALKHSASKSADKYLTDQKQVKEPIVKKPEDKQPFLMELSEKKPQEQEPTFEDIQSKAPLVKEPLFKEPLFAEPLFKEPLLNELMTKENIEHDPLFKQILAKELLPKDSLPFDNSYFLRGMAKTLSSQEMRTKDTATYQDRQEKNPLTW